MSIHSLRRSTRRRILFTTAFALLILDALMAGALIGRAIN